MPFNLDRKQQMLDWFDVDVLVATSPENIFYSTGYMPFQGAWNRFPKAAIVYRCHERLGLAVPTNEVGFVADRLRGADIDAVFFGKSNFADPTTELNGDERWLVEQVSHAKPNAVEAIAHLVGQHAPGNSRIVVDQSSAPELTAALQDALPDASVSGGGEDLWRLIRMVKTDQEIALLRRAIEVNESGIHAVHSRLGNATERELASVFGASIGAAGGSVQHWIGSFGRRSGAYRIAFEDVRERQGRFRFDCGIEFGGYCSDLGGTAQTGGLPSNSEKAIYKALTAGVETALDIARPGIRTSELYTRVIGAVRKAGLPNYEHTLIGHGIGVEPRDYPILGQPMNSVSPFLGNGFDPELEAGMVLNIECPLIQLSDGGFQHEVTLVVERTAPRLLSEIREYRVIC